MFFSLLMKVKNFIALLFFFKNIDFLNELVYPVK